MKKFKNKITGDVVRERSNLDSRFYTNEIHSIPAIFVENSNDWEELEEMPEYVELLPDWHNEHTGEIFCTKDPIPKYQYWRNTWTWEYLLSNHKHSKYFKPTTKEAYETQQKEIQDKELLEKLIKESGLKLGDEVTWGECNQYCKIERFDLVANVDLTLGRFPMGSSQLAIYVGDYYKWKSISVSNFKKKENIKTLTLGDKNIKVTISKGKIEAEGKEVNYTQLNNLIKNMNNSGNINSWVVSFPAVKIGCSVFTLAELEQVVETYNELNK